MGTSAKANGKRLEITSEMAVAWVEIAVVHEEVLEGVTKAAEEDDHKPLTVQENNRNRNND